jgi:hypothetical protein
MSPTVIEPPTGVRVCTSTGPPLPPPPALPLPPSEIRSPVTTVLVPSPSLLPPSIWMKPPLPPVTPSAPDVTIVFAAIEPSAVRSVTRLPVVVSLPTSRSAFGEASNGGGPATAACHCVPVSIVIVPSPPVRTSRSVPCAEPVRSMPITGETEPLASSRSLAVRSVKSLPDWISSTPTPSELCSWSKLPSARMLLRASSTMLALVPSISDS